MAVRLTDARVAAAAKGGKRASIMDAVEPGLELRTDRKGAGFALRRSVDGRDVRLTIGRYHAEGDGAALFTLAQARAAALALKARLATEGDFRDRERQATAEAKERSAYTVQRLIDDWTAHMEARKEVKESTLAHYSMLLRVHVAPTLGAKPVEAVTPGEVAALLDKLGTESTRKRRVILGVRTANQVRQRIGALWKYARKVRKMVVTNPAEDWEPLKETTRERVLNDGEVRAFWKGLGDPELPPGPQAAIALKLCLLLGQRDGEIVGMHESELDLEARLWTVSATRTKSRRSEPRVNIVPLPPAAVKLIKEALALRGKRETPSPVFPSARAESHMRRLSLSQGLARLCKEIGMERATPHDLRRTARTILTQERCGVREEIAERVLSHIVGGKVQRTYDRNAYLPEKRLALESLARVIDAILAEAPESPAASNVVHIAAHRQK